MRGSPKPTMSGFLTLPTDLHVRSSIRSHVAQRLGYLDEQTAFQLQQAATETAKVLNSLNSLVAKNVTAFFLSPAGPILFAIRSLSP